MTQRPSAESDPVELLDLLERGGAHLSRDGSDLHVQGANWQPHRPAIKAHKRALLVLLGVREEFRRLVAQVGPDELRATLERRHHSGAARSARAAGKCGWCLTLPLWTPDGVLCHGCARLSNRAIYEHHTRSEEAAA